MGSHQQSQQAYIREQQKELNTMREKYLNMSDFQMEELRPVDILNLTFEHNKK